MSFYYSNKNQVSQTSSAAHQNMMVAYGKKHW